MKFTQYLPVSANRTSGEHHRDSLAGVMSSNLSATSCKQRVLENVAQNGHKMWQSNFFSSEKLKTDSRLLYIKPFDRDQ